MRKDRSFDDIIKDKLNHVAPVYHPENWERFRERLDKETAGEQEDIEFFDRVVKQKTPVSHAGGFSNNWTALVNRLDIIYRRERAIATSKLLELLALLLLFWTMDSGLLSEDNPTRHLATSPEPAVETISADQRPAPTGSDEWSKTSTIITPSRVSAAHTERPSVHTSMNETETPMIPDGQSSSPEELSQAPTGLEMPPYLVPNIPVRMAQPFAHIPPSLHFNSPSQDVEILPKLKTKKTIVSMFGSTDINSIHTPGSIEGPFSETDRTTITIPALHRFAYGYTGGAALGFDQGRFETEIGWVYTAKMYKARPVLYVTGSVSEGFSAEGLKDIELNMIAVPVQFKYRWVQTNKWRVYSAVGAAFHLVLESNVQWTDQEAFRSSSFNLSLPNPEPSGSPKSRILNAKNLDGGWLQGGGFADNAYVTGLIAAGVERRFTNGWGIFVQPTYQHSLYYFSKGVGPDKDRIHTFSLMSGIRIRL